MEETLYGDVLRNVAALVQKNNNRIFCRFLLKQNSSISIYFNFRGKINIINKLVQVSLNHFSKKL
jgi:hypothetical protein